MVDKTTWKDPKTADPCKKYWVLDADNKTQIGRYYDVGWVDSNYSIIKNVVKYAEIEPPPHETHHSHNLPRCLKCGLITRVEANTRTSCNCGAEIRG